MKELRPLGSEKLNGDEKLKRILELTYYGEKKNKQSIDKPEYVTESKIGGVYGIVKEKDGFYVKKGLNENTLEYIGGMFMKNKNKFSSYGEAFKRLDFLTGQDNLQEATKYVLRTNKPPMEAAPAAPSMSEPPPSDNSIPPIPTGDEMPPEEDVPSPEGEEGADPNLRSGYMTEIQKFCGKLGQELRDQKERLESDDIKYVLNMVISAIDVNKLDDEDLEEIADKFDREDEEFAGAPGQEEEPADEFAGSPEDDQELSEFDGFGDDETDLDETMSKLSEFINSSPDEEENIFSQYSDLDNEEEDIEEYFDVNSDDDEDEFDRQKSSIHNLMQSDEFEPESEPEPERRLKPRFRTKPVSDMGQRPQLDIDEISRAITDALSKYRQ